MKKHLLSIVGMLALLIVIPLFSFITTKQSEDIRSKAAEEKTLPVLPPLSPFIRLGVSKDRLRKGDLLPVFISAKSNGQAVVEAQIVLTYDTSQFVLDEKNIRNENIFPVINITHLEPGKAVLSVFVDTRSGYAPILLTEEKVLATVFLTVIGTPGDSAIRLVHDGEEKTQLFTSPDAETGQTPDILSSTQDVIVHVE